METSVTPLRQTPLYETHRALGARMMPFGGFEMPVQYRGILEEHRAVREAAGLFDVSHMGEVELRGPGALAFLQYLITNDASALRDGRALYTLMCRPDGGTLDDLLVYRLAEDAYLLVLNAANTEKGLAHIRAEHANFEGDVEVEDVSEQTALLALQGPRALEIAQAVAPELRHALAELRPQRFLRPEAGAFLGCQRALLSATGYTGEPGLEIYCEPERVEHVWDALMEAGEPLGLQPAGLGARDTLRLEAGFCLYGHELSEERTPLEAGLGWTVKLQKGDFIGREALARQKEAGPEQRLVGFVMEERGIPRQGYPIVDEDENPVGEVTSGSQSPSLGQGIGLGYVKDDPAFTEPGRRLGVEVRGRILAATVRKPPFHKP